MAKKESDIGSERQSSVEILNAAYTNNVDYIYQLDPFQSTLLRHYKLNQSGSICSESIRITSRRTRISTGKIVQVRRELEAMDLISISGYRIKPSTEKKKRQKRKSIELSVMSAIWDKTDGRCWYCGHALNPWKNFTVDHIQPLSSGGTDDISNLAPCCYRCNSIKGTHGDLENLRNELAQREGFGFSRSQQQYLESHGIKLPDRTRYLFYFEREDRSK